jgi:hypothetical protein
MEIDPWAEGPPPGVPDYRSLLDQAYEQAGRVVRAVVDAFNAAIANVNDKARFLAPVMGFIKKQLNFVREGIVKLVGLLDYAVKSHVPVVSLIVQSFSWVTKVQTPMSDMSSPAVTPANDDLGHWTGEVASAYRTKSGAQKAAIDDVAGKASFISKWLFGIAQANVDFVLKLAGMAVELLSKFAAVALNAATIVNIPFAADKLAEQAGNAFEKGMKAMLEVAGRFVAALGNLRDVVGELGDHTALTNGKWPQAVAG